jgi:Tfp pilus assembly protein PilO
MQELLEKISVRELRLLMLGIGATIAALLVTMLVVPNVKSMQAVSKEIALLEATARDGRELEQQLEQQHASIAELRYQLDGDMANLPVRQVEAYIIGRLQRVSWDNNVELLSVEPAAGERIKIFQELLFNVQLAGHYEDLYRWLLEMRKDLGYVVVKEYRLSRAGTEDENPRLMAYLSLASYRAVE